MNPTDISTQFALDVGSVATLKRQAGADPKAGLKGAAQQFEALFLNMVLKSMREASALHFQDGLFDNEQTRLYQSMLDQQLAQTLAARGATGLAAMLEKQLGRNLPDSPAIEAVPAPDSRFGLDTLRNAARWVVADGAAATEGAGEGSNVGTPARDFVNRLWPHAREAGNATGIPAHFLLAQAALETGWGRSEIRTVDGRPSFNLFNIKAGRGWEGATVDTSTTEYVDGVAQKQVERFRAYNSYAEAFADYANLLRSNPRYAAVIGQQDAAAFARGLQQAGYATDPMYAEKLMRIIGGATLRQALAG